MKIFFCDNRLGGLLGFRIDIIRHLADIGHEVCLVVPSAKTEWDKVGTQTLQGVRIIEIELEPSSKNPIKDSYLLFQYFQIFRRERPDIVFNYTIKPNIYSSIAAKWCGSKVICMVAGLGYMFEGSGLIKKLGLKLYKYGLNMAEKVLVLNKMNYDKLKDSHIVSTDKLILLKGGEGVNLNAYPYQPSDYTSGVTFLMIARVLYDKGYVEFVEAIRLLRNTFPNAHFEILGPIAYDSPMGIPRKIFEQDKKEGLFKYLGVVPNAAPVLSRPDIVVVLPSYHEGLNRSLMEACAIGRPIITSDIPGCKETVEKGVNGYLVPPKNIKALAEAMSQFMKLPPEAKKEMAEQSYKLAKERFDIAKVISVYDKILCGE